MKEGAEADRLISPELSVPLGGVFKCVADV